MSESPQRYPRLDKFYKQYLSDASSAEFVRFVSSTYNLATLERLATSGSAVSRRAAILALGLLGTFENNEVLGRALNDADRAVRMLADQGVRQIWRQQGSDGQQQVLKRLYRLIDQSRMDEAIATASELIAANPELGEAYHQRAVAYCAQGNYDAALVDCRETLQLNRYHFPAAIGLAHCCMQLDEPSGALAGYRLALNLNPDLDAVRRQVSRLERILENNN